MIVLAKNPEVDYRGYFKSWDVRLNGVTVGTLYADLENKFSVTDVYAQPVAQSSTIRAAFRKAVHYFGGVK